MNLKIQNEKQNLRIIIILMVLILNLDLQADTNVDSVADRNNNQSSNSNKSHDRQRKIDLIIGLCAGQKLATNGTTLTLPTAGQKPEALSAETKAVLKEIIDSCYEEITGKTIDTSQDTDDANPT